MATESNALEKVLDLTEELSTLDQLRLIELLVAKVRGQQKKTPAPVDMLSLAGVGADLWQRIDVDAYLEQERASWDA